MSLLSRINTRTQECNAKVSVVSEDHLPGDLKLLFAASIIYCFLSFLNYFSTAKHQPCLGVWVGWGFVACFFGGVLVFFLLISFYSTLSTSSSLTLAIDLSSGRLV